MINIINKLFGFKKRQKKEFVEQFKDPSLEECEKMLENSKKFLLENKYCFIISEENLSTAIVKVMKLTEIVNFEITNFQIFTIRDKENYKYCLEAPGGCYFFYTKERAIEVLMLLIQWLKDLKKEYKNQEQLLK